jgi:hypothetical protein
MTNIGKKIRPAASRLSASSPDGGVANVYRSLRNVSKDLGNIYRDLGNVYGNAV